MKKIIFAIITFICLSLSAQVTTPLSTRRGAGGEALSLQQLKDSALHNNIAIRNAQRSIEQAEENLRLNRDYYRAGTSKMSDLLQAQLLYQQSLDHRTDAYADYQNKLLEYRHSTGQF